MNGKIYTIKPPQWEKSCCDEDDPSVEAWTIFGWYRVEDWDEEGVAWETPNRAGEYTNKSGHCKTMDEGIRICEADYVARALEVLEVKDG